MFTKFITACTSVGAVVAIPVGQIESMLEITNDDDNLNTRIFLLSGKTFDVTNKIEEILAKIEDDVSDDDDEWDDGFEDED